MAKRECALMPCPFPRLSCCNGRKVLNGTGHQALCGQPVIIRKQTSVNNFPISQTLRQTSHCLIVYAVQLEESGVHGHQRENVLICVDHAARDIMCGNVFQAVGAVLAGLLNFLFSEIINFMLIS